MDIRRPTEIKDPIKCPNCGESLGAYTDLAKNPRGLPKPGDLSLCSSCAEPCEFGDDNNLVKLSEKNQLKIKDNSELQKVMALIESARASEDSKRGSDYVKQLDHMAEAVKTWKADNPNLSPIIQYNFQKGAGVIAALNDAIDNHFVSANDDAMLMFKELGWLEDKPTMPTVLMVRVVIEHTFGKEE